MNPLYLDPLVTTIAVDESCLVVKDTKNHKVLARFKPREIPYDALIIQKSNGMITFAAIDWLTVHGISVSILDWKGNITAQVLPEVPTISNELRLAQYQAYLDRKTHLSIARTIILTKLHRQKQFLQSLGENYPEVEAPRLLQVSLRSEDFMRNSEARYATQYFEQYGKVCNELGHVEFSGRGTKNNMHANDLPNALLNYGYAVLQTYVRRALNSIGLDNSLPFVHELGPSTGLVFDLMEFWRVNVDYAVLETLKQLFRIKYNVYRLNENFEAVLSSDTARLLFERVRFNLVLEEIITNCRMLARYMLGESRTLSFSLKPVSVKAVFENQEVKNAILTKSHKELGMNKSTLWYQKKRLSERGTIRLYNISKNHFVNT